MTEPLDMSKDPDRFVPDETPGSPLDWALHPDQDPDRFQAPAPRGDETLVEMLGDGAHVDERDNLSWLFGLIGIIGFLAVVSLLLQLR